MLTVMTLILLIFLITEIQIIRGFRQTYVDDLDDETFELMIAGSFRPLGFHSEHMVSLRTTKEIEYWGDNHFCAGVIINFRTVLTAAHCIMELQKVIMTRTRIRVIVGTPKRLQQPLQGAFHVKKVIPHPDYKRYKICDIAVLILQERMTHNPNLVVPIIMQYNQEPQINTICHVLGWGQIFPGGPYANELLYMSVVISEDSVCKEKMKNYVSRGNICGVSEDDDGDVCPGDTGGPLICNERLVGIIAGSKPCTTGSSPMKFTSIPYFATWIDSVSSTNRVVKLPKLRYYFISMILSLYLIKD